MDNKLYLEELEKNRAELAEVVPEFKPQYSNKHADGKQYKTQTLREIAEHSNYFKIEIHPNIIDELIARERLDRAKLISISLCLISRLSALRSRLQMKVVRF